MNSTGVISTLIASEDARRKTVLWLRGTGINAWWYYGFLEKFSLEQLSQFKRIIAVSGGAAVLWVSVLARTGHFDPAIVQQYDEILRRALNRRPFFQRIARLLLGRSPYTASDNLALLRAIVREDAAGWTFADFPLRNFRVLTALAAGGFREFGEPGEDDGVPIIEAIAQGGTPFSGQDLRSAGLGPAPFDFENASQAQRQSYKHYLRQRFPDDQKLVLNTSLQFCDEAGKFTYLRLCSEASPRWRRLADSSLLFLGLPNPRYAEAFAESRRRIAPGCERTPE